MKNRHLRRSMYERAMESSAATSAMTMPIQSHTPVAAGTPSRQNADGQTRNAAIVTRLNTSIDQRKIDGRRLCPE
ncbi:MAG: hypothetical protein ABL956_17395 [Hyphomonadaceae bacterium]